MIHGEIKVKLGRLLVPVLVFIILSNYFGIGYVSSVPGYEVELEIYSLDGRQFFDFIEGRYLIRFGFYASSAILQGLLDEISDWGFNYPDNTKISFDGYSMNLSTLIGVMLASNKERPHIVVTLDTIFIFTNDYGNVLSKLEAVKKDVTRLYISALHKYLVDEVGLDVSYEDVVKGIGSTLKFVVVESPIPRVSYDAGLGDRFDELLPQMPRYLGGFGYDPVLGTYFFLIYRSCDLGDVKYSYSLDEVIEGMDSYLRQLFSGDPPTVVLAIMDRCTELYPLDEWPREIDNDMVLDMDASVENAVEYTYVTSYVVDLTLDDIGAVDVGREGASDMDNDDPLNNSGAGLDTAPQIILLMMVIVFTVAVSVFIMANRFRG